MFEKFDRKWDNCEEFCFYDFNAPESIPNRSLGFFDIIVIDPPFISKEVWGKYVLTTKLLLKDYSNGTNGSFKTFKPCNSKNFHV